MSEFDVEQQQEEEFVAPAPAGDATPDEYTSNDQSAATSEETGVTYGITGEPETTPHDLVTEDDEGAEA